VKYLIPAAAIGILSLCGLLRREDPGAVQQQRTVLKASEISQLPRYGDADAKVAEAPSSGASEAGSRSSMEKKSVQPATPSPMTQEMELILKDELELSEEQQIRISAFLGEREAELRECHETIRKSGVFIPREYGKVLGRMKPGWYLKIDGVLDSRQHLRFDELVAEGFLRPGTEFGANLNEMIVVR
jgi:hypothetical protein